MILTPVQLRVLGSLMEKEITTPETYPLSLNALVNACNQRSSRDPVMELTEEEVRQALHALDDLKLTSPVHDGRVPKYENRIRTVLNLRRDETALLCLLLLRGPQTPGELRSRADRMYSFDDLASVTATLDRMAARSSETEATGPLTAMLPRQPGSRESRYMHLLGGPMQESMAQRPATTSYPAANDRETMADRLDRLEAELTVMQAKLDKVNARLESMQAKDEQPVSVTESPVN